jgi:hypothetical protein
MLDQDLIKRNVAVTQRIIKWLQDLGYQDQEFVGRLGADLGDIYAGLEHYSRLVDALLEMAYPIDQACLGELLSDLQEEMRHLNAHITSGLEDVDALMERLDDS